MKKILLTLTFLSLTAVSVNAGEFTVEDTHSRSYLENNGYSDSAIELVERSRARAMGEEYIKPVEHPVYESKGVKWFRKFWMYTDPALDRDTFMNHSINYTSTPDDL